MNLNNDIQQIYDSFYDNQHNFVPGNDVHNFFIFVNIPVKYLSYNASNNLLLFIVFIIRAKSHS